MNSIEFITVLKEQFMVWFPTWQASAAFAVGVILFYITLRLLLTQKLQRRAYAKACKGLVRKLSARKVKHRQQVYQLLENTSGLVAEELEQATDSFIKKEQRFYQQFIKVLRHQQKNKISHLYQLVDNLLFSVQQGEQAEIVAQEKKPACNYDDTKYTANVLNHVCWQHKGLSSLKVCDKHDMDTFDVENDTSVQEIQGDETEEIIIEPFAREQQESAVAQEQAVVQEQAVAQEPVVAQEQREETKDSESFAESEKGTASQEPVSQPAENFSNKRETEFLSDEVANLEAVLASAFDVDASVLQKRDHTLINEESLYQDLSNSFKSKDERRHSEHLTDPAQLLNSDKRSQSGS